MTSPDDEGRQRRAALDEALRARTVRARMLAGLKTGDVDVTEVLGTTATGDSIVAKTKVLSVLKAVPGVGQARAQRYLGEAGIAEGSRVGGLGRGQRAALIAVIDEHFNGPAEPFAP